MIFSQGDFKVTAPVRTCCACGRKREKVELVRFVWQHGEIITDFRKILPGRGAYCCSDEKCLAMFMKQQKKWKRIFRL